MADEKTGTEDTEEFIILETPPEDKAADDKQQAAQTDTAVDDDEDDDGEDTRLAASDDDSEAEIRHQQNVERRRERRERAKRAREAQEQTIAFLRQQVENMGKRLSAQEGFSESAYEASLVEQYNNAVARVQQAERIMAAAMNAQNGDDHTAAIRIRDDALLKAHSIKGEYDQLKNNQKAREAPQPQQQPQGRAPADQHRAEWLEANPWFDNSGNDADSATVKALDQQMQREGFDPNVRGYWEELTRRTVAHLGGGDPTPAAGKTNGAGNPAPGERRGPPRGGRGDHAPGSTRREIYVTPERKQAMQEAGVWDDPAKRNQMLKAYDEYDRQQSGR